MNLSRSAPLPARLILVLLSMVVAVQLMGRVPARAAGNTYYVSPSGSDSNPGTLAQPWQHLGKALKALYPGDTLYVRGGTYRERIGCWVTSGTSICTSFKPRAGTATSPVKVLAYGGERPIVQGVLWLHYADYWTLDGINATWDSTRDTASDPIVKWTGGVGWTHQNSEVWGAHSYATVLIGDHDAPGELADWRFVGNCIHDTYKAHDGFIDHNLYIHGSRGAGLVERNLFFNASSGENIKVGSGQPSLPSPAHVTIRYNTLYNAAQNMVVAHDAHDNRFERNIMGKATGKDWYPNIRGFYLTGKNNIALSNIGFAAKHFILNTDSTTGVKNAGGNSFPMDPHFDSASSCKGFHPGTAKAKAYGRYGGTPVVGHWNGAGADDTPAWVSGGKWRQRYSNSAGTADHSLTFGSASDVPVAGDWDGDGVASPGVFRNGVWYLRSSSWSGATVTTFTYGKAGDKPIVGDWDGNGTDTVGVVRGNEWLLRNSNTGGSRQIAFTYARSSDVPIVGDWNGDDTDQVGVFRAGTWYLRNTTSFAYGLASDRPVVGDWNGDGVDTIGVVRGSLWALRDTNNAGPSDLRFTFDLF